MPKGNELKMIYIFFKNPAMKVKQHAPSLLTIIFPTKPYLLLYVKTLLPHKTTAVA